MLTEKEIEKIRKKVNREDNNYPGMTYEEGILDAIDAILEDTDFEEFIEQFDSPEDE